MNIDSITTVCFTQDTMSILDLRSNTVPTYELFQGPRDRMDLLGCVAISGTRGSRLGPQNSLPSRI